MTDLRKAAEAVLERWDSPAWEWKKQGPTADLMANLRKALAAEQPKHPGYIIGSHWLETAYSRICAGEAEADVLRDCGLVRITDGMAETADIHAIVDRQEALRRDAERLKTDAEMMRWLIDNHTAWSWNPSPYNTDVIGGFAAFSTGYLGFDLKTAIRKAMQDSALQEDKT